MEDDKIKAEFPRRLKEWRMAKGMSQKKLDKIMGLNGMTHHYEKGTNFPSIEVSERLVELGFDPSYLPEGIHHKKCTAINDPLTDEEQRFAEAHHGLVYSFLACFGLSYDEWYDVAVLGYLRMVKKWFARPEIHIYSFSHCAYNAMRSSVSYEFDKKKRRFQEVSLNDIIPGTEDMTYGDIICDPRDCVKI